MALLCGAVACCVMLCIWHVALLGTLLGLLPPCGCCCGSCVAVHVLQQQQDNMHAALGLLGRLVMPFKEGINGTVLLMVA